MLSEVSRVALVLLPKFLGLHRVLGISPVRVPGLPVGVLGDGCGGVGIGGGSVINSVENVKAHPRGQEKPENQTGCFPASDGASCSFSLSFVDGRIL